MSRIRQVVVAQLVEEANERYVNCARCAMSQAVLDIRYPEEQEFPNYGYASHIKPIKTLSVSVRSCLVKVFHNTLTGEYFAGYYNFIKGEIVYECTLAEIRQEMKRLSLFRVVS
jgi:hypothetical protein